MIVHKTQIFETTVEVQTTTNPQLHQEYGDDDDDSDDDYENTKIVVGKLDSYHHLLIIASAAAAGLLLIASSAAFCLIIRRRCRTYEVPPLPPPVPDKASTSFANSDSMAGYNRIDYADKSMVFTPQPNNLHMVQSCKSSCAPTVKDKISSNVNSPQGDCIKENLTYDYPNNTNDYSRHIVY